MRSHMTEDFDVTETETVLFLALISNDEESENLLNKIRKMIIPVPDRADFILAYEREHSTIALSRFFEGKHVDDIVGSDDIIEFLEGFIEKF